VSIPDEHPMNFSQELRHLVCRCIKEAEVTELLEEVQRT
jgi:hypothetical protein